MYDWTRYTKYKWQENKCFMDRLKLTITPKSIKIKYNVFRSKILRITI